MKSLASIILFLFLFPRSIFAIAITEDSVSYSSFGKITMYIPAQKPSSIALFISGDGGWKLGVINMARNVADQGALVAGIDYKRYYKSLAKSSSSCYYPAADFERLSMMLQKKYKFSEYVKPVLIGYSAGATLVYGLLAQAPANTFKGAVALGFCPDIQSPKPLCEGYGLSSHHVKNKTFLLDRTTRLTAPFIVLNGVRDLTCPFAATKEFLKGLPSSEFITLSKVGHGFSIADNWLPQFNIAYKKVLDAPAYPQQHNAQAELLRPKYYPDVSNNLPLSFIPSSEINSKPLVFLISGDGGWTSFDHSLAETIASQGMPVVGLDSQKYFWNPKSPERTTEDISKTIDLYMQRYNKKSFILMGYSFGACIVPFVANRIPFPLKEKMKELFLISPDEEGDFEIHISDMLGLGINKEKYDVVSELKKIESIKPVCLFETEADRDVIQRFEMSSHSTILKLAGGHHFSNNYKAIVDRMLEYM